MWRRIEDTGCTNPAACNYDLSAIDDDGSCILPVGCDNVQVRQMVQVL